jgi:hypothetical protein
MPNSEKAQQIHVQVLWRIQDAYPGTDQRQIFPKPNREF